MPAELPLDDEHIMEDAARVKSVRTLTDLTRGTLLGSSINDVRHVLFLCIHSLQAAADPTHAFASNIGVRSGCFAGCVSDYIFWPHVEALRHDKSSQ